MLCFQCFWKSFEPSVHVRISGSFVTSQKVYQTICSNSSSSQMSLIPFPCCFLLPWFVYRSLMILRPSHVKHNNKSRLPTLKNVPSMNLEASPWIPTQHTPENHLEPSTIATNCPWSFPKCLMSWLMSVLCLNRIHPPHDCWNHPKPRTLIK